VVCKVAGGSTPPDHETVPPRPLHALSRRSLSRISGCAVAANLPSHIPQRMADRARTVLADREYRSISSRNGSRPRAPVQGSSCSPNTSRSWRAFPPIDAATTDVFRAQMACSCQRVDRSIPSTKIPTVGQ